MGHYNSEMESKAEFHERMDPVDRRIKIIKSLDGIPLSAFEASDFKALFKITAGRDYIDQPDTEEMDRVESRIQQWKKDNSKKLRRKKPL